MPKTAKRVRLHPRPADKFQKVRLPIKPRLAGPPRQGSKLAKMLALLIRPNGTTLGELVYITNWHEHSVRAALSKTFKSRMGMEVASIKSYDRIRRYYAAVPESSPLSQKATS